MDDVQSVRDGFAAFARGDVAAVREKLADDIVWHVPGRSALSGDHRGTEAVMAYFRGLAERSGGTFRVELRECAELAPGLVAGRTRATARMPHGEVDQEAVQLFRREGDRTVEAWLFPQDLYALDEAIGGPTIELPDARTAARPVTTA